MSYPLPEMTPLPADDTAITSSDNPCAINGGRIQILSNDSRLERLDIMDLSIQIQQCETWDALAELCVRGICSTMGAVNVRWTENASDGKRTLWACASSDEHAKHLRNNIDNMIDRFGEVGVFYQKLDELMQEASDDILQLKKILSPEEYSNNSYVRDFLTPDNISNIVSMQMYLSKGGTVVFCLGMPEGELTTEQMDSLKFIQQHVRLACNRLARLASFTNLTDTLKELWKKSRSVGVSVLSYDGEKLWDADAATVRVIEELGGGRGKDDVLCMPKDLAVWAKGILSENARICAQTGEHTNTFLTNKGLRIKASLLIERAGSGALLVVKRDESSGDYGGIFTRREQDVIRSITEGMTSQEVSESLHISKRTVDKHLENIYLKLGVSNRISALKSLQNL